jgi:non-lysosomal glucosylceramidase
MSLNSNHHYLDKPRSGIAHGGIGTGGPHLRADGLFYDWGIFNNYPFGSGERLPFAPESLLFFVVRYQQPGKPPRLKALQFDDAYFLAGVNNPVYEFPWLTGVAQIDYEATFPYTRLRYTDPDMPFTVTLEAYSPFIPHDVKNSALPAMVLNFQIEATAPVLITLVATMRNSVGYDTETRAYQAAHHTHGDHTILQAYCGDMDARASSFGSQALASSGALTYHTGWGHRHPYYEDLLRNPEFSNKDVTEDRNWYAGVRKTNEHCYLSLAHTRTMAAGETHDQPFVFAWHFPNLMAQAEMGKPGIGERREGHYYNNFFNDAAAVAQYMIANRDDLARRTRQFHDDFYNVTVEGEILDQVNSHLNTFISSGWLTEAGDFGIQEGLTPAIDWGPLATVDVALYGNLSAAALFPSLNRAMLEAYKRTQAEHGQVGHGIVRDFAKHDLDDRQTGRVDMPAQYAILALRHYLWTNDHAYLRAQWESITAALDYAIRERDPNGDGLPDMVGQNSGCSYDNFPMWGASSYVGSLWLSALDHALYTARTLDDQAAIERYTPAYARAQEQFTAQLWNGAYYRLYNDIDNVESGRDEGCLTDQLIGQWANHLSGLGDLVTPERRMSALQTILDKNFDPTLGLRNCGWPDDGDFHAIEDSCWFDQANTYWSGVELAFASFLIYEGCVEEGLTIVRTVDRRYRKVGRYFDHQEWGGHYYRPMSAWGVLHALLGLQMNEGRYRFAPKLSADPLRLFFATPDGTAHYEQDKQARTITVRVRTGSLRFHELQFQLPTSVTVSSVRVDQPLSVSVASDVATVRVASLAALNAGEALTLHY